MTFEEFQILLAVALGVAVLLPLPACWQIARRAGLPGWSSLLVLVPVLNILAVYWFAFGPGGRAGRGGAARSP